MNGNLFHRKWEKVEKRKGSIEKTPQPNWYSYKESQYCVRTFESLLNQTRYIFPTFGDEKSIMLDSTLLHISLDLKNRKIKSSSNVNIRLETYPKLERSKNHQPLTLPSSKEKKEKKKRSIRLISNSKLSNSSPYFRNTFGRETRVISTLRIILFSWPPGSL